MTIPRRVLLATDFLSKLDIFILAPSPFNQNTARVETSSNRAILPVLGKQNWQVKMVYFYSHQVESFC